MPADVDLPSREGELIFGKSDIGSKRAKRHEHEQLTLVYIFFIAFHISLEITHVVGSTHSQGNQV
jgi:hypothetical protein